MKVLTVIVTIVCVFGVSLWVVAERPGTTAVIPGTGDVNFDGLINADDVALFADALRGTYDPEFPLLWTMDMNGDYRIGVVDLYWLALVVHHMREVPAAERHILSGDTNNDGVVDCADVRELRTYLNGDRLNLRNHYVSADLDGDQEITEDDYRRLVAFACQ
jgi:hypothetical protein